MRLCRFACRIVLATAVAVPLLGAVASAAEPAWKEVSVPDDWKKAPAGEKGRLWYRTKIAIPAAWQGRPLALATSLPDSVLASRGSYWKEGLVVGAALGGLLNVNTCGGTCEKLEMAGSLWVMITPPAEL